MAKRKKISMAYNPIRWRWRSLKNWFYHKWMVWRGYTPTTFNLFDNRYKYEKRIDVDKICSHETLPAHELVGFKKKELPRLELEGKLEIEEHHIKREIEAGKHEALEALRKDIDSEHIVCRSLPRE